MSAFVKPKLKLLRESLAAKDWPFVLKHATDVLGYESSNYNARVFLSLALFNLDRFDEAEESYKKAIEMSPSQALARQGLASFYEKRERFSDCSWCLLELMELFLAAEDALKFAETLQKLIQIRRSHGTPLELVDALSHLLPTSSSYSLLSKLPPADPTSPTASTVHSLQLSLISCLPTLLELVAILEKEESRSIETEVKKRRQRLGGQAMSASETRKAVEAEKMKESQLVPLYESILNDPDASERDDLRRDIEARVLLHWRTLLAALPSSFDLPSLNLSAIAKRKDQLLLEERDKKAAREAAEDLARGMVLIGVQHESAWNIVLEWSDRYAEWEKMDWIELDAYTKLFPETGLSRIIRSCRSRATAIAKEEDEDTDSVASGVMSVDEMVHSIEDGIGLSPDSLLAHLIPLGYLSAMEEWDSVAQISEAGLAVLRKIQSEIGRSLQISQRTLESHLAIALVHLGPPKHHLRALRLLESLISVSSNSRLLAAKACVLQHSERWSEAINVWLHVLDDSALDPFLRLAYHGEWAWCLVKVGEFVVAETSLLEVVQSLEELKTQRDGEKMAKEKARSKAGTERGEGVQEGETTAESSDRARAWWRLGSCRWEMYSALTDRNASQISSACDAFTSSIRARPTYAPPFTSLGIYYRIVIPPDLEHASKCFQKAFELDGSEEVAARYLAEEFSETGEWDLVELIARRVVNRTQGKFTPGGGGIRRLSWAWKAIGGADLNAKKYDQAITAFQSALRGSPRDVHTWIKLGVAYRSAGKHVASLKVFSRALSIDPTSWYPQFLIGDVQREIGLLEPAIKAFRSILLSRPEDVGVRVVLAETLLSMGQEEVKNGFFARAEESMMEALVEASSVLGIDSSSRVAWRIVSDALSGLGSTALTRDIDSSRSMITQLLSLLTDQQVDNKIDGMDLVTIPTMDSLMQSDSSPLPVIFSSLAVLAYKMLVLLETQNEGSIGSAWFDLGIAISVLRGQIPTGDEAKTNMKEFDDSAALHQAIRCIKFALHKEPMNSTFWNALGVLSFDLSPRLSQHSFIKAIEYNSRSAIPWTNLGLLYLLQGDPDLANQSLLKAQVIDPDWTAAWVGQAILAEQSGHLLESSTLFEHAFSLAGHSPEADVGFAASAFALYRASIALSSESLSASSSLSSSSSSLSPSSARNQQSASSLSAPIFALTRYLSQRPNDITALHLIALLLEQVGDLTTASDSLEKAAALLEELFEIDESAEVEAQFVIAQTNLGRVRLAKGDYAEALESFDASISLLATDAIGNEEETMGGGGLSRRESILLLTECRLGSAVAHYFLEDEDHMDSAIASLERGLEDIDSAVGIGNGKRAELDIALGKIHWNREGGGGEDLALASFMDAPGVFTESAPLFVKLSMQAIGIVAGDRAIMAAADRTRKDPFIRYHPEITRILALRKLVDGDTVGAIGVLERSVHAAPWASRRRFRLASLLLRLGLSTTSDVNPQSSMTIEDCTEEEQDDGRRNRTTSERLLRPRLLADENASERAARLRMLALGKITERVDEMGAIMLASRMMESAVHLVPWESRGRKGLEKVHRVLAKKGLFVSHV